MSTFDCTETPLTDAAIHYCNPSQMLEPVVLAAHAERLERALRMACRDIAHVSGNCTAREYVDYLMKEANK